MSQWQQDFAEQMEALRGQAADRFERAIQETIEPVFKAMSDFVSQWQFRVSTPQAGENRRNFKFALTEDSYVIVGWRFEGVDTLECDYEYCVPGAGRVDGVRTSASLRGLEREWVESCFQTALSAFAKNFANAESPNAVAEPVLA